MQEPRLGPKPRIDWDRMKREFIESDESMTTFAKSRGLSAPYFLVKARELGFLEARNNVGTMVSKEVSRQAVKLWLDRWDIKSRSLDKVDEIALDYLLNGVKVMSKEGEELRRPLMVDELVGLTTAIEKALRCHKLLKGEPTGEINSNNLTILLAKFVQAVEKDKVDIHKIKEISQEVFANGADIGNPSEPGQ